MIYILGGTGFIGSALARYCELTKIRYNVITRNNYNQLKSTSCDIFINANGNSKKYLANKDPLLEFDASVRSVKASLTDFNYKHYIHLSSCDVYPDCSSPKSTNEEQEIDISKQSIYGFHKYLAEQCVRQNVDKWLIVRMGGFVGPDLRKNPIYDIINNETLWLNPNSRLQFMHTSIFSEILFALINRGVTNQVLNICGNGTIHLNEVIEQINSSVTVNSNNPLVCYDVSIQRLKTYLNVPETKKTVLDFIVQ